MISDNGERIVAEMGVGLQLASNHCEGKTVYLRSSPRPDGAEI